MVESCLPEDLLKTWERKRGDQGQEKAEERDKRLEGLLKFIENEVNGEEACKLAQSGFAKLKEPRPSNKKREQDTPTIISLVSTAEVKENRQRAHKPKNSGCLFCEQKHDSQDCRDEQITLRREEKIGSK